MGERSPGIRWVSEAKSVWGHGLLDVILIVFVQAMGARASGGRMAGGKAPRGRKGVGAGRRLCACGAASVHGGEPAAWRSEGRTRTVTEARWG